MLLQSLFLVLSVFLDGRLLDLPEVGLLLVLSLQELLVGLVHPGLPLSLLHLLHLPEVVLVMFIEFDVLCPQLILMSELSGARLDD